MPPSSVSVCCCSCRHRFSHRRCILAGCPTASPLSFSPSCSSLHLPPLFSCPSQHNTLLLSLAPFCSSSVPFLFLSVMFLSDAMISSVTPKYEDGVHVCPHSSPSYSESSCSPLHRKCRKTGTSTDTHTYSHHDPNPCEWMFAFLRGPLIQSIDGQYSQY